MARKRRQVTNHNKLVTCGFYGGPLGNRTLDLGIKRQIIALLLLQLKIARLQ